MLNPAQLDQLVVGDREAVVFHVERVSIEKPVRRFVSLKIYFDTARCPK